jgi:(+)-trans-carveol dehydrogenase/(-)-trans-carveol dehydrogenase
MSNLTPLGSASLAGKVALVTGAARGQGRNHAIRLAENGADVIAVDVCAPIATAAAPGATEEDLALTAASVEKLGRRCFAARTDVRDPAALRSAVDDGVSELGHLDVVVANAGIFNIKPALELDPSTWAEMIDVNLNGVWNTCWAALPHLTAEPSGGAIVLVGSVASMKGMPGAPHYVAAKHGLVGLTRVLAAELGPQYGIRVNIVLPTNVATPMILNDTMFRTVRPDLENPVAADTADIFEAMNLLPVPWVTPDDVSDAVLWLASDQARYVTGTALPVDAGCLTK